MNRARTLFTLALSVWMLTSCSVLKGKKKEGCPSDGRNVGAEKLLSEDKPKKKQPKFRGAQSY